MLCVSRDDQNDMDIWQLLRQIFLFSTHEKIAFQQEFEGELSARFSQGRESFSI
jgi:hypothetical protein